MHHFIVVSGLTQRKWAKHGNGNTTVYKNVRELLSAVGNIEFALLEWHNDPEGYAKFVAANYNPGDKIVVAGYSYGGGFWVRVFLKTLAAIAPRIKVETLVLCDPVYRHPVPLLRFLAMFHITLRLPHANVKEVLHFTQRVNRPGGHKLRTHKDTIYTGPVELNYPHVKMDNSVEYHDAVLEAACRHFLEGVKHEKPA